MGGRGLPARALNPRAHVHQQEHTMATSPLLGIDADDLPTHSPTGIDSMGPSDLSDSGSDSLGVYGADPDSDTDSQGSGERRSVGRSSEPDAVDILPDHVESMVPSDDNLAVPEDETDDDAAGTSSDDGAAGKSAGDGSDSARGTDNTVGADFALAAGLPAPDQRGRASGQAHRPLDVDDISEDTEELNFDDGEAGRER